MKKMLMVACAIAFAGIANAATVSWSMAGGTTCAGDAYGIFIIGQKGVESTTQIATLLNAGTAVDSYMFGSGNANASGLISVSAASSGKTLDAGDYTAFFVVFNNAAIASADQYLLVSGASTLSKTVAATTPTVAFAAGNQTSYAATASNWTAVPEPTSGLLILLGMAGLALKRKVA